MVAKCDIVSVSPHQVYTTLGSEAVVLELQASNYFGMNDVGTAVWNFLQQPREVSDVIEHIVTNYEVSAEQAEIEILSFIQNLVDKNLVVVDHRSAP
jgi:DNA phosphorothioation-dependent restriction protein DptG